MNRLREQNAVFSRLLGEQTPETDKTYRRISFCRLTEVDGRTVAFHALTGAIAELTAGEEAILRSERVPLSPATEPLIRGWYLVPEAHDDITFAEEIREMLLTLNGKPPLSCYTVFPTTDCNARCFYCYELGMQRLPMSAETARAAADFMLRSHGDKPISIHWFGGEPLYNAGAIDLISTALCEAGVPYKARMISNGYLFDRATAARAASLWKLYRVQITLDGTEKVYNKTKAYIYRDDRSPFKTVTDNIEGLLAEKISVGIRMNMGAHNREDLYRLLDWIDARYKDKTHLRVYPHLLFDDENDPPEARTEAAKRQRVEELIALERACEARGLLPVQLLPRGITTSYCMMDSPAAVTVLPNGTLGKCEHHVASRPVGDLVHGVTDPDRVRSFAKRGVGHAVCDGCAAYPICGKLEGCPVLGRSFCDAEDRRYALVRLDRSIAATYRACKKKTQGGAAEAGEDLTADC